MKKFLALVLALMLVLSLAACGAADKKEEAPAESAPAETTPAEAPAEEPAEEPQAEEPAEETEAANDKVVKVGYVQLIDNSSEADMYERFLEVIDEAGLTDNIIIDFQSASGDAGTMSTIIQGFVDNKYDIVVPVLTPPTQAAVSICGGEVPILFQSVVDPVYSKIIPDWDTVDPAINATGTSNTIPADKIIDTANGITPLAEGEKVLILYNSSQNNSQCTMEAAAAYCDEQSIPYDVVAYTDVTDAITQVNAINPDDYGYAYVTLDSVIAAAFNQVGAIFADMELPVYAAADAMTYGGAFCSYGVDYHIVGEMTANMLVDWYNGKALTEMPCQRYSDFQLIINEDVLNQLGITLPEAYAAEATYVNTVAN
ncbi:MAG: ABC transporter substrate-binding protein [Oscillospiraceae bacterium]|nr:ABC transporter substrate-binding protein [Oscillospiraceae bacterium]